MIIKHKLDIFLAEKLKKMSNEELKQWFSINRLFLQDNREIVYKEQIPDFMSNDFTADDIPF